ncbi:hypothetical protein BH10CYA1_BH10CYA1_22810 [soil metagenome]
MSCCFIRQQHLSLAAVENDYQKAFATKPEFPRVVVDTSREIDFIHLRTTKVLIAGLRCMADSAGM